MCDTEIFNQPRSSIVIWLFFVVVIPADQFTFMMEIFIVILCEYEGRVTVASMYL